MLVVHPASSWHCVTLLDQWHCMILLDHWHCVTLLGHWIENSCFEMLKISAGKVQNSKASPGWIFSKDCFLVLYQYSIYSFIFD